MSPQSLAPQGSPALLQPGSRSPTELAGLQGDRLTAYQELRTDSFKAHLSVLGRRFRDEIKQPLAFYYEVYEKGNLSALELDKMATGIEKAFKEKFPKHPLPSRFHQQQISVEYWVAPCGSNVNLCIQLLMKEVQ